MEKNIVQFNERPGQPSWISNHSKNCEYFFSTYRGTFLTSLVT